MWATPPPSEIDTPPPLLTHRVSGNSRPIKGGYGDMRLSVLVSNAACGHGYRLAR